MTTGNKTLQPFTTISLPFYPSMTYGTEIRKVWSGGDSITALKPLSSYPNQSTWTFVPPQGDRRIYGMVRYGRRDHFQVVKLKAKQPRGSFREKEERSLVWNPYHKRWEYRPVSQQAALREGWLKKLAIRKSLPPNAYTMTKTTVERSIWACTVYNSLNATIMLNTVPIGNTPWPTLVIDVSNEYKLIDKLRSKAYGSGFNPGIFLAEGPKAITMVGVAAMRLGAAIHRFKTGDWRGMFEAFGVEPRQHHKFLLTRDTKHSLLGKRGYSDYQWRDASKKISGLWLELAYGWKPLLSDMEAGAAWMAYALNPPLANGGTVSGRRQWKVSHFKQASNNGNLTYTNRDVTYKLQIRIKSVVVSPSSAPPSLPSLAAVAWELVPFSFVVDWAAPISSYLQALRTARDIKGTVVRTLCTEKVYTNLSPGGPGLNDYHPKFRVAGVNDRTIEYTIERSVSSEIKVPSPLTGYIDGHDVFSAWQRTVNAVALLVQGDFRALARGFSTKSK